MPLNTLSPQKSFHRLRTAFLSSTSPSQQSSISPLSPTSPTTPISLTPSSSSSTLSSSSSRFFPSRFFNLSSFPNFSRSSVNTQTSGRPIRRRKSTLEMEQEEELLVMGDGLVGLIEPRPWGGLTLVVGGIEEVLEGRA
ncbi:unnamed protein product [Zymoseptoria tritici ST99CH_1E4]|uniref:Uncharacterized protein n=1 Tax=Zymoseptoria tritici ST99CH_1E4 TaxID=1276532 RepID=A0A2H1FNK9_ZYMTR|nr:unnamed protein product [Zymoseptoria tritici ST99CH_1E4]